MSIKSVVFRIRTRYFDQIVWGQKTIEFRKDSPFWRTKIDNLLRECGVELSKGNLAFPEPNVVGVFICGKRIHRRIIEQIVRIATPSFSEQGRQDVNTPYCFAFHLGPEVLKASV